MMNQSAVDKRKGRARSIQLPALQFASLRAMGIDVPWITAAALEPVELEQVALDQSHDTERSSVSQTASHGLASRDLQVDRAIEVVRRPAKGAVVDPVSTEPTRIVAESVDVDSMDLEQLTQWMRDCQICSLSAARKNVVPGQGVRQPSVMVIGEAPGEQEDLQGQPFVGPSGQLLDNMLASIGLSRAQNVYIANTIKCRPPGNRNPREEEIQSCMPYLRRQISLLQPEVILAVGLFASQTLLQSKAGVQSLRTQPHSIAIDGRQIPVIVTYHPAYLLRRPADKRLAWQDLKQVWSLLQA